MKKELRILVLEDVIADVHLMDHELRSSGLAFETMRVETRDEFIREIERGPPDIILSDHGLPEFDGFAALAVAREHCPETPFIFVTGSMGEALAIDSLRSGATDYVLKTRISSLVPTVVRALRLKDERQKRRLVERELRESEERFRCVVSGLKDHAVITLDAGGRITSWNPGAELVLGYREAEAVGKRFNEFYPPEENAAGKPEADLKIAASDGRLEEEGWRRRKGDTPFWARVDMQALRDDEGRLRGFTHVIYETSRAATGQRTADCAHPESDAHIIAILQTSPDAIVSLDHKGVVNEWNSAAERIFGHRRESAIGQRLETLIVPPQSGNNLPALADYLPPAGAGAMGRRVEVLAKRQSGEHFPIELALTQTTTGDTPVFTAFIRDITGTRQAEEALRRSESRKAAVLETALDAIISIDQAGKISEWNPAAEQIFGYSRELALSRDLTALIVPRSNEDLHRKGLARFLQTGRGRLLGQRTEVMAMRANGAEFPVELTITKSPGEGPLVFTTFIRDITERRRTEDVLRKSEERFRLLVEGVRDYGIYLLDAHGRITTWNAGAERIAGFRTQEIIGRRFHRFYDPADVERKKPDQALAVATADGYFQDERWQVRKDGTRYWARLVITALRDETGKLTGFSMIARDITQRKQDEAETHRLIADLEKRVDERTSELRAAHQEMEAFSYSISHDLRAPLIHIAGFVEMLKKDLGASLDPKSSRHLQTICDSTETMGRMIADLLTFSRIGRAEMHPMRFDLNSTVKEVRRDLHAKLENRKVDWVVAALPEVHGDPVMIRQALQHLLGNAVKYTRQREEARIEVIAETTATEHIIGIRDNGAGFEMKYASKLFGVFQRLHLAREFEGTGIGLANVRRIVGRHGGRTWAEGAVNAGATFYFSLPIVTSDKA